VELHLLLKLGTHLGLLDQDLLLDVLVGLDFELGVNFLSDPIAFFLEAQCFIVLQLLEFELLLEPILC
jgi:hypothetical protein